MRMAMVIVVAICLLPMGVVVVLAVVMAIMLVMLVMLGLFVMVRMGGDWLHGGSGRTAAKNADSKNAYRQHAKENAQKALVTGNRRTHHASPDGGFSGWAAVARAIIPIMSAER
jgi:hypothetical protein